MTDNQPTKPNPSDNIVRISDILKENKILSRSLVFFILMLFIPVLLAWKFDWFLVAN